jgi:D-alanine-D-alanine ligase
MPTSYEGHDIFIDKNGVWHRDGAPRSPDRALIGIDAVISTIHGEFGEDGKLQKILETMGMPFFGSDAVSTALSGNKIVAKQTFQNKKIKTPYFAVVRKHDNQQDVSHNVFHHFYLPFIVKPSVSTQAAGVTVVKDFRDLAAALAKAFYYSDIALVEEYIAGKEAKTGIIEDFRYAPQYVLLPVEHRAAGPIVPGAFSDAEKRQLEATALLVHNTLGLRDYSESNMIVHPRRGIFVLGANTAPQWHKEAHFVQALEAVGSSLTDFLHNMFRKIV